MSSEPRLHLDGLVEAAPADTAPIVVEVVGGRGADGPRRYELRPAGRVNLLGVFREVYFHHDPTFGFRNFECGRGICSTCNVRYDGKVQKACRIPVAPGTTVRIEAQSPDRVLRDVACAIGDETDADD